VKKLFLVTIITLLLLTLMPLSVTPAMAADITLATTINGLEKGEQATLVLSPRPSTDPAAEPLIRQTITGGGGSLTTEITAGLKDGGYQLLLEAPEKYFREPKGYLFVVNQSQVVNPVGRTIVFELIPPAARSYEPYREPTAILNATTTYVAEALISLSAPMKQLQPGGGTILGQGYHYAGPWTTQDNTGVHGRFTVPNPDVVHNGTYNQFIANRVMARNDAGNQWIEIGWAEISWDYDDDQWVYEFDSANHTWYFYSLPGSPLEVKVEIVSGTTWVAKYYSSGNWVTTKSPDIGISTASMAENCGEVYTLYTDPHPNLPTVTTDIGELRVSGSFERWDVDYYDYSDYYNNDPYHTHPTYDFYSFNIHNHF